jgi:hypothetical protein
MLTQERSYKLEINIKLNGKYKKLDNTFYDIVNIYHKRYFLYIRKVILTF